MVKNPRTEPRAANDRVDASERLRRLLAVLPLFAAEEEITLDDLERRAGVDAETFLQDLAAVTERFDVPGGFVESIAGGVEHGRVVLRTSHFLRPMRLTVQELCAIELGLAMLAALSAPDEQDAITRARERVRKAIVQMPAVDADTGSQWHATAPPADGATLQLLRDALAARRKVSISYAKTADSSASERVVRPYALMPSHGTWYLVAFCERSDGIRFFRLDRMGKVEMLGASYELPDGAPVQELLKNGKPFFAHDAATLRVRYSARIARWIAEREKVPLAADGSLTVDHPLADRDWAVRHVLQYGPDAEVLAPPELRDEIVRRLHAISS